MRAASSLRCLWVTMNAKDIPKMRRGFLNQSIWEKARTLRNLWMPKACPSFNSQENCEIMIETNIKHHKSPLRVVWFWLLNSLWQNSRRLKRSKRLNSKQKIKEFNSQLKKRLDYNNPLNWWWAHTLVSIQWSMKTLHYLIRRKEYL